VRRAIVSVEIVKTTLTAGDGEVERVHKIKLIDKGRMHEVLARHVGIFNGAGAPPVEGIAAFSLPSDTPGLSVH
jgi:hypothetical protein